MGNQGVRVPWGAKGLVSFAVARFGPSQLLSWSI